MYNNTLTVYISPPRGVNGYRQTVNLTKCLRAGEGGGGEGTVTSDVAPASHPGGVLLAASCYRNKNMFQQYIHCKPVVRVQIYFFIYSYACGKINLINCRK